MCPEGEGEVQEASFTCDKCGQRMCRTCRRLHDRFTDAREHHVRTLNADDLPGGKEQVKALCSVHREQELCFHCQRCDVSICLHCKLTSHEGHVTEDMATAVLRAKQELAVLVAKADKQLRVSQAYLSRMERDELELKRQKREVEQRVNSRYDFITTWATRARDEVLEALEAKGQTALNKSRSEMTAARVAVETINGLVSRASGQTASGPDVVLLKNELQAALLTDDAFDHQSKMAAREEHLTFLSSQADDTALDLGTVRAYVGELVPDGDEGSEGSSRFSLRQLAGELQKAKEETAESILKLHAELKADLSKLKSAFKEVAFHARCGETLASQGTIIFDSVWINVGNGYSQTTGIFTAPVPGVYMFLVSVRNLSSVFATSNVSIFVENHEEAATNGNDTRTAHTVVKLKKGQQVWVFIKEKYFSSEISTSFFTGALIQAQVP